MGLADLNTQNRLKRAKESEKGDKNYEWKERRGERLNERIYSVFINALLHISIK